MPLLVVDYRLFVGDRVRHEENETLSAISKIGKEATTIRVVRLFRAKSTTGMSNSLEPIDKRFTAIKSPCQGSLEPPKLERHLPVDVLVFGPTVMILYSGP